MTASDSPSRSEMALSSDLTTATASQSAIDLASAIGSRIDFGSMFGSDLMSVTGSVKESAIGWQFVTG